MNNDLEQFSEERLIKLSETKGFPPLGDVRALARIALSVKQAKPVGYAVNNVFFRKYMTASLYSCEMKQPIEIFYTTPPANSPAIPDGWKLVPIEPTDAMQVAAANAIRFDTTAINKLWTGKRVFDAMLAAAPKPESE